jgi:DNA processing protein
MAEDHTPPSLTPLTPPHREEEKLGWVRLLRSRRVGPATFRRLMAEHGTVAAALDALPDVARAAGIDDYAPCPEGVAAAEIRAARIAGARMIAMGDSTYPEILLETTDAPPFVWAIGDISLLARPMVALVGARNASSLGLRTARRLAEGLGTAGYVVVSGLARGIDTASHEAALHSGTIAVLAGGVDVVYPPENAVLAQEISERGLRLSEQPMGLQPQARHFPSRNRIVAGLCKAVVVVEAAAKSGSLITARDAADLGRDVLAVPGHPIDARAGGCNMLIRDGATLVRDAADVIEALGSTVAGPARPAHTDRQVAKGEARKPDDARAPRIPSAPPPTRDLRQSAALHGEILRRLGPTPLAEDQLRRDMDLPDAEVAPALVALELDGQIRRHAGGLISRP